MDKGEQCLLPGKPYNILDKLVEGEENEVNYWITIDLFDVLHIPKQWRDSVVVYGGFFLIGVFVYCLWSFDYGI